MHLLRSKSYRRTSPLSSAGSRQLEIDFDTDLTTATQGLTLNVDGTAFAFEDASTKTPGFRRWNNTGLSWTAGNTVSLTLTEPTTGVSSRTLSIADASAAENAGHLMFEVTLSRSFQNTVKVDFETISGGTATEGEDYHARRKYTHVILAGDRTAQMGFALIEDTAAAAGETVKVKLSNARVVDAYGDKIKDLDITTDEATGTITAPTTTTTDVPGLTIGIRDATGDEDDGWLDFRVRLSRKYTDLVCYDFETISGGSATEGTDYLKIPKATYWMQIGKRVDKPFVRIIDDSVNDDGETVKVKISNAHLCDDPSQTVPITRAEATGTINNSDPIPQAWLARFGRTAAEHMLDGVQARLSAPRNAGMEVSLAGRSIRGRAFETVPEQYAAMHAHGGAWAWDGLESFSHWMANGLGETGIGGSVTGRMNARNLMPGSAFALTADMEGGSSVAVWGRGAYSGFSGQVHDVALDGEVATAMLGTDYAAGGWIAGLSLSFSEGDGTYRLDGREGALNSRMTGLYPYVGYEITDRLSAWGVAGYGRGGMMLTLLDTTDAIRTDIGLTMWAMGARCRKAA